MKRIKLAIIAVILMGVFMPLTENAYAGTAVSTLSKLSIDGKVVDLKTYNIEGSNYIKLVDMAWFLKESPKQFDVVWNNEMKAVNIVSSSSYSGNRPLAESISSSSKGKLSNFPLYKDGDRVELKAYLIDGRTYFKLKELCALMDISLVWDEYSKMVVINSNESFKEEPKSKPENIGQAGVNTHFGNDLNSYREKVLSLVNQERISRGLNELKSHAKLDEIAQFRAKDMFENSYFSHTSPIYGDSFKLMEDLGYTCAVSKGENIARGQNAPEKAVTDWMNSNSHRANILKENYEYTGIGIVEFEPGRYIWVQLFSQE